MSPPQDTVQRGPPQTWTGGASSPRSSRVQQVSPATSVSACFSNSVALPQHGHVGAGVSSGSGCCDGWRHPGSSHPRQSRKGWPAKIRGEDGRQPAGDGETLKNKTKKILFFFISLNLVWFALAAVLGWQNCWQQHWRASAEHSAESSAARSSERSQGLRPPSAAEVSVGMQHNWCFTCRTNKA